jgi:hypothetical protein
MSKMIVVREQWFDEAFDNTLNKLALIQFKECGVIHDPLIDQIHRAFHYEVCNLRDYLKDR